MSTPTAQITITAELTITKGFGLKTKDAKEEFSFTFSALSNEQWSAYLAPEESAIASYDLMVDALEAAISSYAENSGKWVSDYEFADGTGEAIWNFLGQWEEYLYPEEEE